MPVKIYEPLGDIEFDIVPDGVDAAPIVIEHASFQGLELVQLSLTVAGPTANGYLTIRGHDGEWDDGASTGMAWLAGERESNAPTLPVDNGRVLIGARGAAGRGRLSATALIGFRESTPSAA